MDRFMGKKFEFNVWLYWENVYDDTMPPYLQLCLETIEKHCCGAKVNLVTPENLSDYLNDEDIPFDLNLITMRDPRKSSISLQVDFIRVALLRKYGGLWTDIDCIFLKNPIPLLVNYLKTNDFVAMRKTSKASNHITVNWMASQPNGDIISQYYEAQKVLIQDKYTQKETFEWAELGADLLTDIVNEHVDAVYFIDEELLHPFDFTEAELLQSTDPLFEIESRISKKTICCMLFHSVFDVRTKYLPREIFLQSTMTIAEIMRMALSDQDDISKKENLSYSDVTIIFQTFHRSREVRDFLKSIRMILGDKIKISFALQDKDEEETHREIAKEFGAEMHVVSEDFGLAAARNYLVERVDTPYTFLCDDDFVFTSHTRLDVAYRMLYNVKEIDILGGLVNNFNYANDGQSLLNSKLTNASYQFINFKGLSEKIPVFFPVEYMNGQRYFFENKYYYRFQSQVNNFALIRTSVFKKDFLFWDPIFKIMGEHEDFYLTNYFGRKVSVAYTNALYAEHHRRPNKKFMQKRQRQEWHVHLFKKWNIGALYFPNKRKETLSPDGKSVHRINIPK